MYSSRQVEVQPDYNKLFGYQPDSYTTTVKVSSGHISFLEDGLKANDMQLVSSRFDGDKCTVVVSGENEAKMGTRKEPQRLEERFKTVSLRVLPGFYPEIAEIRR